MLKANSLSHYVDLITEDEELSPSLETFVVLTWLKLIYPDLPRLVKQRYGTELRSRTLASIKPEVSQSLNSLVDETRASDDAKVMRTATVGFRRSTPIKSLPRKGPRPPRQSQSCPLCQQAGRPDPNHFLSECRHLSEEDRKYIAKARQIASIVDDHLEETDESAPFPSDCEFNNESSSVECVPEPTVLRVQTRHSPDIRELKHETFLIHERHGWMRRTGSRTRFTRQMQIIKQTKVKPSRTLTE